MWEGIFVLLLFMHSCLMLLFMAPVSNGLYANIAGEVIAGRATTHGKAIGRGVTRFVDAKIHTFLTSY